MHIFRGRRGWFCGLVLVPLAIAVAVAFLSAYWGAYAAWGMPTPGAAYLDGIYRALKPRTGFATAEEDTLRTLEAVNDYFNQVPAQTGQGAPEADPRWATPAELLAGKGGRAADYVIAKYLALRALGIPASRLRVFVAGRNGLPGPHFVLAYYASPDAQPLILDNFDAAVRSAAERADLAPVYSFDPDDGAGRGGHRKWREMERRLRG